MPSSFDEAFELLATPHLVGEFGESIVYTLAGEDTPLTAMVLDEQTMEEETQQGHKLHTFLEVEIGRDPASARGGIAEPRLDATVTIRGVVYAVKDIASQSAYSSTLRVTRIESKERSRAKYRV